MPTLNWIGKEKVIGHHLDVPFRVLEHRYGYTPGGEQREPTNSGNRIIHGDNLEALKALLPEYEGKIQCVYIDPPYNTGNEGWVYNDNVNDPRIGKWLNDVVGKEGEDLTRHDKWLCMMYPRLKLLHRLLRTDGIIFVSLDDNEATYAKLMLDEIFGARNFIQQIIWKNKYGPGAMTKGFGNIHEYILCYSKTPITSIEANLSEEEISKYKSRDEHYATRGGYITQPLATKSKDDRPNLVYPLHHGEEEIWPDKQWIWSRDRMLEAQEKGWLQFNGTPGNYNVRFKQYLKDERGVMRKGKPISILQGPYNQDGTAEITAVFGRKVFDNPKPVKLVEYLISMIVNDDDGKDGIYLDSFAGSGTTAHAVLNLNKSDGGRRRFIGIEMNDYAETITAERVKRVIKGYADIPGTGGAFDYYELGEKLFTEDGEINELAGIGNLRRYVWYTETGTPYARPDSTNEYLLGVHNDVTYYFYYDPDGESILNYKFLATLDPSFRSEHHVFFADSCALSDDFMRGKKITFKKIPRDITKF